MRRTSRTPCPPNGGRSGSEHRDRDGQVGFNRNALVRIRDHGKVPGHIETGYENGLDVLSILLVTGESNPGCVVVLGITFKRGF